MVDTFSTASPGKSKQAAWKYVEWEREKGGSRSSKNTNIYWVQFK